MTGFPYDMHVRGPELVELFGLFLGRARAVRRLGSAALDLCYVAAGRFDGFWEQHLKPWDVAAGALVVTEAGGRITGMDGARFDARAGHLVASNGLVHGAMLEVIGGSRASRTLHRTALTPRSYNRPAAAAPSGSGQHLDRASPYASRARLGTPSAMPRAMPGLMTCRLGDPIHA